MKTMLNIDGNGNTPARSGLQRYSNAELVPMVALQDIPILPTGRAEQTLYDGGPVWPDWDTALEWRHGRSGIPMPARPRRIPKRLRRVDDPLIWGGYAHHKFGHLVAEYATRVLQSAKEKPDAKLLFALGPDMTAEQVPGFFWQIMDWYGVGKDRISFIEEPFMAKELWVAPQAEQLGGPGPSQAYLDLLHKCAADNRLEPIPSDLLYVSRATMRGTELAVALGEGYLEERLRSLGVTVLAPETVSVRDQLAHYAGARHLVFAEGSAVHGRQLLGYHAQGITILVRRPLRRIAIHALLPRCRHLNYAETAKGTVTRVGTDDRPDIGRAVSAYDTGILFRTFADLGVDLQAAWEQSDFQAHCEADLLAWIEASYQAATPGNASIDWHLSSAAIRQQVQALGFGQVLPEAEQWLGRGSAVAKAVTAARKIVRKLRAISSRR